MKKRIILLLAPLLLTVSCELPDPAATNRGKAKTDWNVKELSATRAHAVIRNNPDVVVLDVRTPGEFADGHVENAVNIDFKASGFGEKIAGLDSSKTYIVHCRSGNRSGKALPVFKKNGFGTIYHMDGGFNEWKASGLPVKK